MYLEYSNSQDGKLELVPKKANFCFEFAYSRETKLAKFYIFHEFKLKSTFFIKVMCIFSSAAFLVLVTIHVYTL